MTVIIDNDKDGMISQEDIQTTNELLELELREEKADSQRKMAWAAIVSMVITTVVIMSPMVSDTRVQALSDLLGLFYIAQAGVVGAYMGVTAWMNKPSTSNSVISRYNGIQTARTVPQPKEPEI